MSSATQTVAEVVRLRGTSEVSRLQLPANSRWTGDSSTAHSLTRSSRPVQGRSPWLAGPLEVIGEGRVGLGVLRVGSQDLRQPGEAFGLLAVAQRPQPEVPASVHIAGVVVGAQFEPTFD